MTGPPFDLDHYLDRVGVDGALSADLDGLVTVQAAQLRAIPFENLDVLLGPGIDIAPAAVYEKLVTRRRGGYCFECNTLLRDALAAMGFEARTLLGRVVIDRVDGPVPARTHAVVEVRLGAATYIADCGFGAQTARTPLRLEDGAEGGDTPASRGGWRLRSDPELGWRLFRTQPDEPPRDLYAFDQSRVYQSDIAIGNHWTSTHPSTHFTQRPLAVRHTDAGRIVLNGRRLIEHIGGALEERSIDSADALLEAIRNRLGIPLDIDADQLERLWATSQVAQS
ncbi:MAG: arylamine N-acetyltransferase [bacterium]|nr:arylamine N-acetyltransferase [bacterium]